MSQGDRIPLAEARVLAEELVALLRPECARIEIAGSIRRERAMVADIEIVAIPRMAPDVIGLFAELAQPVDMLAARINALRRAERLALRDVAVHRKDGTVEHQTRDGLAYKALAYRGFAVDLFVTDVDGWGVIFALRTGPGDWNEKLVTDCKLYFRRVEGKSVLHLGRPVPCPEEADFFRAIGQPWIEPRDRAVERVHIVPPDTLS